MEGRILHIDVIMVRRSGDVSPYWKPIQSRHKTIYTGLWAEFESHKINFHNHAHS